MTTKISELPVADALTGTELVPIVQTGTTKNVTVQDIANLASGGGAAVLSGLWDMSAVAPISCAYGLIASEAQVMSLGFAGKLTMSNADQTGSRTLSGAVNTFAAFPDISAPQTFDLTSGKKVVEWEIVMPALDEPTGSAGAQVNIVTATMAQVFSFRIQRLPGSATTEVAVELNGATVYYDNFYAAGTSVVVGAEFDSATNTARVILDGNVLTLSSDSYAGSGRNAAVVFIGIEDNNTTGVDIGKTYSVTLRTAASDITQTYGAGAIDICANSVPPSAVPPVGATAGSIYQISGAGSYGGVSFAVDDLAFFLADATTVVKIPAASVDAAAISSAIAAIPASQAPIQFQDNGTNEGTAGVIDTINFTGSVVVTRDVNLLTVDIVGGGGGGGGVQSVVAGTNVTVDNTDPLNPVVSATGGGSSVRDWDLTPASVPAVLELGDVPSQPFPNEGVVVGSNLSVAVAADSEPHAGYAVLGVLPTTGKVCFYWRPNAATGVTIDNSSGVLIGLEETQPLVQLFCMGGLSVQVGEGAPVVVDAAFAFGQTACIYVDIDTGEVGVKTTGGDFPGIATSALLAGKRVGIVTYATAATPVDLSVDCSATDFSGELPPPSGYSSLTSLADAPLPVGSAPGDILKVIVAGSWNGVTYGTEDGAIVVDVSPAYVIPTGVTGPQLSAAVGAEAFDRDVADDALGLRISALEAGEVGFASVVYAGGAGTYEISSADVGRFIELGTGSAVTVLLTAAANDDIPVDAEIHFAQADMGALTLVCEEGSGIKLLYIGSASHPITEGKNAVFTMKKTGSTYWRVFGQLLREDP